MPPDEVRVTETEAAEIASWAASLAGWEAAEPGVPVVLLIEPVTRWDREQRPNTAVPATSLLIDHCRALGNTIYRGEGSAAARAWATRAPL
jgi:hypothetical protein